MTLAERKDWIHQCLMYLYEKMGAVIDHRSRLLYWPVKKLRELKSQCILRKPLFFLSGFMSESRGLHWKRG